MAASLSLFQLTLIVARGVAGLFLKLDSSVLVAPPAPAPLFVFPTGYGPDEFASAVAGRSDEAVAHFVRGLASGLGGGVLDERALSGFVPYYSGTVAVQSLDRMLEELLDTARRPDGWMRLPASLGVAAGRQGSASLHDVVGRDGVLQIVLEKDSTVRADISAGALGSAGIKPTRFAATDVARASAKELAQSCPLHDDIGTSEWCAANEKVGPGCLDTVSQAITDSHRRALVAALARNESDWTMIVEDDVVPVHPETWEANFQHAWPRVPAEAKIVRLARCVFEEDLGPVRKRNTTIFAGDFQVVDWSFWTDSSQKQRYYTGGCTTGYMVKRDIIPELLGLFPCCCPIDCCLENQFFYAHAKGQDKEFRGEEIMTNLDHWDTHDYARGFAGFAQEGIMVQDNRVINTSRPAWIDPRSVGGDWKATTRSDGK